jgi:hypothetical protein
MEISDDMYIIRQETAKEYLKNLKQNLINSATSSESEETPEQFQPPENISAANSVQNNNSPTLNFNDVYQLTWSGEIPHQKWVLFYSKVLSKFVQRDKVTLNIQFQITSGDEISQQTIKEVNSALRDLELEVESLKTF